MISYPACWSACRPRGQRREQNAALPLQALSCALGNRAFAATVARQAVAAPAAPAGAEADIEAFRARAWPVLADHTPSSGMGRFDVELDAAAGKVAVVLKVGIDLGDRMYRRHGGGAVMKRGSTTGVMSAGEEVPPQNDAAFAEAVARITGMPEWTA